MTRVSLLLAGLAVATLLLANQPSPAAQCPGDKCKPTPNPNQSGWSIVPADYQYPDPVKVGARPEMTDADLVGELIKVMDEAKSPGTLVMSALTLAPMGKKAQAAIPALIRNAERLKLLNWKKASKGSKEDYADLILEVIEKIQADAYPAKSDAQPDSSTSNERLNILLDQSEYIGQLNGEWRSFWLNDQPSHLKYARVNGGIGPGVE